MKAVIFDLDGTLVDSAPDIAAAANAMLHDLGHLPLSLDVIRSFIGNGVPKLVERVMGATNIKFAPELHKILTDNFIRFYADKPAEKTVLYAGVADMLDHFAAQGYVMGICTNKVHGLTMQVLNGVGIAHHFKAVIGGDSLSVSKPDPKPLMECVRLLGADQAVYVGDSEVDAATATAAEIRFGLFTQGYRKSPITDLAHEFAFDEFAELPKILTW